MCLQNNSIPCYQLLQALDQTGRQAERDAGSPSEVEGAAGRGASLHATMHLSSSSPGAAAVSAMQQLLSTGSLEPKYGVLEIAVRMTNLESIFSTASLRSAQCFVLVHCLSKHCKYQYNPVSSSLIQP